MAGLAGPESPRFSRWITRRSERAVDWLESTQQPSGAWGETCRSYDDPTLKGTGEPTPSQTAWATLGLDRRRPCFSPAVRSGIDYLIQTQLPDGSWNESSVHRHRFPPCLLSSLSPLSRLFSAHGDGPLPVRPRRRLGRVEPSPGVPDPGPTAFARFLSREPRFNRRDAGTCIATHD